MKIIQMTSSLSRTAGGPFVSIRRQAQELISLGCDVEALGIVDRYTSADSCLWEPVKTHAESVTWFRFISYAPGLGRQLAILKPSVIHTHGLWLYHQLAAYRFSATSGTPLIVSPRGMLESWAFRNNFWKKYPLWFLYEKQGLQAARVLHATSPQEAEGFRALGLTAPIAVIPNGVDLPQCPVPRTERSPQRNALFLSRIHPKKGLLNLVEAWRLVHPPGWRVIIAGPDENGHEQEVKNAVSKAGLEDCFVFTGPVYDEAKSRLYSQADLFILPSYSENFGNVIAEALAYGIPVITTTSTPWSELVSNQCGWWIETGVYPLVEVLKVATAMSLDDLSKMGERGQYLVKYRYSWSQVAAEMKKVYEWMLSGGPLPGSIRVQ